jgi:hypothetical protein
MQSQHAIDIDQPQSRAILQTLFEGSYLEVTFSWGSG